VTEEGPREIERTIARLRRRAVPGNGMSRCVAAGLKKHSDHAGNAKHSSAFSSVMREAFQSAAMRRVRVCMTFGLCTLAACEGQTRAGAAESARVDARPAIELAAGCYRAPTSIMGRTSPLTGHGSVAPGWLQVNEHASVDSGTVRLVDADGAAFAAAWRRTAPDSIRVFGRDDFMEITIRARLGAGSITGAGLITSDADVQRNAAGQLEPLRREWSVTAQREPCDAMPADPGRRP